MASVSCTSGTAPRWSVCQWQLTLSADDHFCSLHFTASPFLSLWIFSEYAKQWSFDRQIFLPFSTKPLKNCFLDSMVHGDLFEIWFLELQDALMQIIAGPVMCKLQVTLFHDIIKIGWSLVCLHHCCHQWIQIIFCIVRQCFFKIIVIFSSPKCKSFIIFQCQTLANLLFTSHHQWHQMVQFLQCQSCQETFHAQQTASAKALANCTSLVLWLGMTIQTSSGCDWLVKPAGILFHFVEFCITLSPSAAHQVSFLTVSRFAGEFQFSLWRHYCIPSFHRPSPPHVLMVVHMGPTASVL